jgi:ParB family transcriptional regulator, chromosome partitioning protein
MKRKALGKGLSALLPDPEPLPSTGEAPVGSLEPNPYQPRTTMHPEALAELARSIRESGIVQPILVRRRGERYQIIAGERRWRAAEAAGLSSVPVSVREVPDEQLLELALVENVQRQELSPLEEAQAFQRLSGELGLSQEEIARRVGRDRTTVANTVRLLKLPRELRELLSQGKLDAGHARALLALERAEDQLALGREAARKQLSVREVERRVALLRAPRAGQRPARKEPNTAAAEERLRRALGTRVLIARRGKGGAIRVLFKGEAELQRLFELLLRAGRSR